MMFLTHRGRAEPVRVHRGSSGSSRTSQIEL